MPKAVASTTVENYLKVILLLQRRSDDGEAAAGDIAHALRVTPGTVSTMIKRLAAEKLVRNRRYGGIQLTTKGRAIAVGVVRRHRLIETFLVQVLGLDWSEVHDEAERLEHAVSDKLLDRIDAHLGRPEVDPHGDPIPDSLGRLAALPQTTLADARLGERMRIVQVDEHDIGLLHYLRKLGLGPGAIITAARRDAGQGIITIVTASGEDGSLAESAAAKIVVSRASIAKTA